MKPIILMKSTYHHPADTARRAVPWERALANSRKTRRSRQNLPPQPAQAHKPASSHPPVRRTAVRFASQSPQRRLKCVATTTRARKRLILNHQIKAQPA